MKVRAPTILDIEASGFGSRSYPIEIGVARGDGARFCRLIKPLPGWEHWEQEAQDLHGLTREHLVKHGVDAKTVCLQLNEFMEQGTAYSDGWVVDNPWLIRLYADAGVNRTFKLSALDYLLNETQMTHWKAVKTQLLQDGHGGRHRASVDAELIQQTFIATAILAPQRKARKAV